MPRKMSGKGAMLPTSDSGIKKARTAYTRGSTQPRPRSGLAARNNTPARGRFM